MIKLKTAMNLLRNWEEWTGEIGTWREVKLTDKEGEEIADMLDNMMCCGNCKSGRKERCNNMNVVGWGGCQHWQMIERVET